ncbi:MAG: YitT family protein [Succinivibrio sp.]
MSVSEYFRRYFVFFLSVVFQGSSIALITYADIGTTPISSANYVFSLHSDLTLGDTTLIFNLLLIILQIMFICIGEDRLKNHLVKLLMQIPVCFVFSFMIDLSTQTLDLMLPENISYTLSWVLVFLGVVLLAFSIALSVTANVAMVSGEYFIKIFHPIVKKSFSFVKTFFDIFLVSSAVIISFYLTDFSCVEGVREGTVFAALCTGPIVHFLIPYCKKIERFFA